LCDEVDGVQGIVRVFYRHVAGRGNILVVKIQIKERRGGQKQKSGGLPSRNYGCHRIKYGGKEGSAHIMPQVSTQLFGDPNCI
jgi:hypothetical protein